MSNLAMALVFTWSVTAVAVISYILGKTRKAPVSKKEKQCGREKCKSKNCE